MLPVLFNNLDSEAVFTKLFGKIEGNFSAANNDNRFDMILCYSGFFEE